MAAHLRDAAVAADGAVRGGAPRPRIKARDAVGSHHWNDQRERRKGGLCFVVVKRTTPTVVA